jgi:iron complex transport system substrate-binding protein
MPFKIKSKPASGWFFLCIALLSITFISKSSKAQDKSSIRLVTLSPHLAELVASAGAIDNLVGVVAYSDFPKKIKSIQQVGDAFKVDYETILTLNPDYILSWKGGTPQTVTDKLKNLKLNVIETEINTLADIPKVINQIAQLTHTELLAKKNTGKFSTALNNFKAQNKSKKTIFIETYHQPLYTVSGKHWISEAISICGYHNIFDSLKQLSVPVTLESVISKNPQAILTIGQQSDPQWFEWKSLTAVKNKQIFTIHPDFLSRPTLRILIGIEKLCRFN